MRERSEARRREPARADPAPEITRIARTAENPELLLIQCLARPDITAPDFGERSVLSIRRSR
jgi:hypothetical protein